MTQRNYWQLWLKIFGVLALLAIGFALLAKIKVIFIPLVLAIVIHVLLAPLVAYFERRGLGHRKSVGLVFGVFMVALSGLAVTVSRYASSEIALVREKWPQAQVELTGLLQSAESLVNERLPDHRHIKLTQTLPKLLEESMSELLIDLPIVITEAVIGTALVFIFGFFLLRDGRALKKMVVAAVPNRYFEMTLNILYRVNQQVSNYLRGLTLQALADTLIATLLCFAFGLPNALLIGLIVGATTVVPVVGLVISGILGPLFAIFGGGDPLALAVTVLAVIAITHFIDNLMVAPLIMGHSVHMHPILVIVSLVLAGKFFGMFGILLAVPTMSVLLVLLQEGYRGLKSHEYYLRMLPAKPEGAK